ncbi:RING finger 151-like, partial [Paramuricea clavata]
MASYDTGYEDELFEHPVGPSSHCGICYNVVKNPVMCRHNEHLFCRACITRHLMNSQTCPLCLEPLAIETLSQPSRTIMNLLSELKIRCQFFNRGCETFIELGNLEKHIRVCGFAPAVCSNEGCRLEVNKQDLLRHETAVCELRRVQCHNCNDIRHEMDVVKVNLAAVNVKLNEVVEKLDRNEKKLDRNEKNLTRTVENIAVVVENVDAKIELVQGQLSKQKETNCQLKADNVTMKESLNNITKQLEKITQQTSHTVQAEKGKKGIAEAGGIDKEPKNVISGGTSKLSVGISNRMKGRTTTTVTSPMWPAASGVLNDVASVKWIKSEIFKAQSGLWATRLEHLYKEKFKKVLPVSFIQELKFRPDIATVEEPISGRYLLYAPRKQQPPPTKTNQRHQTQVNVNPDFALPYFLPDVG